MTTTETAESGTAQETTNDKPAKTAREPKPCQCRIGTGEVCDRTTGKAFAQGHDARLASRLAQKVADEKDPMTADEAAALITEAGGSDLLVGKMRHSAELRKGKASAPAKSTKTTKTTKKDTDWPEKADTDEAKAVASAGNQLLGSKVKVAHGDKQYDAVVVKDATSRTVARHRLIGQNCDHEVEETETGVVTGEKIKK